MLSLHELPSESKVNIIIIITLNVDCHLQKRNRSSIIWNTFSVEFNFEKCKYFKTLIFKQQNTFVHGVCNAKAL